MGARNKLNVAYVNGALILSGLVGLATGSWQIFALAAMMLIGMCFYAGDIRTQGRRG